MGSLAFTLNFDDVGVLQSVTITGDQLPSLATVTMKVSGTAIGSTPIILRSASTDASGHILVTIIVSVTLMSAFHLGGAGENIPGRIVAGHSLTAVANVGDPTSEVIGTLTVS